ncbi:MAG: hypothetical protein KC933_19195 [Myxococcales bacterium]|nr:hypothetical protein [Myxococcales bacterium]
MRFAKQLGFTGGGAGFASSAFGFENLKCAEADAGCDPTMGFVRSPPHAFGSGYVQTLAEEMSWELQALREQAIATPGVPVPLVSKGVDFGMIQADANGTLNLTEVVGVSADLVVRPFQWRGIASNLRNFIRDAMNFHFSVQAKEFLDVGDRRTTMEDKDQVEDEMTEGDITAVATFLTFLRPPTESTAGLDAAQVALGREAFFKVKCDSCHRPTLHLDKPVATIRDPRKDTKLLSEVTEMLHISPRSLEKARESHGVSLTVPLSSGISPTLEKLAAMKRARMSKGLSKDVGTLEMVPSLVEAVGGYARDLSRPDGPPETLPRLPEHDGGIDVPLYSDLKRHDMGSGLEESFAQKDDCGHEINGKLFLTRPLWGVADTGPWMHDGRALTLTEAIRAHGGEASDELEAYEKLDERERVALRAFLSSLRLPTVPTKVGS